ncbi:MAG: hypothetical protein QOJ87_520 [Verrucomicrobiota bacterium]|jgi:hypothetical protein
MKQRRFTEWEALQEFGQRRIICRPRFRETLEGVLDLWWIKRFGRFLFNPVSHRPILVILSAVSRTRNAVEESLTFSSSGSAEMIRDPSTPLRSAQDDTLEGSETG